MKYVSWLIIVLMLVLPVQATLESIPGEVIILKNKQVVQPLSAHDNMQVRAKSQSTLSLDVMTTHDVSGMVKQLAKDDSVLAATPNYLIPVAISPNDALLATQDHHPIMENYAAWNKTIGKREIIIAIIDTGVNWSHEDLAQVIWNNTDEIANNSIDDDGNGYIDDIRGWDFVASTSGCDPSDDCSVADNDPSDSEGHGTHVAGISASQINNGLGGSGVCGNCTIMVLRAGYDNGATGVLSTSAIIGAIMYATDNGADIISMSFGAAVDIASIETAIQYAANANVTLVGAAGNDNDNDVFYPAGYKEVIAVGATTNADAKSSYSNYGSWVDISVPGDTIYSTVVGGGYNYLSGTSMATPAVSGLIGLYYSLYNISYNATEWTSIVDVTGVVPSHVEIGKRVNSSKTLDINCVVGYTTNWTVNENSYCVGLILNRVSSTVINLNKSLVINTMNINNQIKLFNNATLQLEFSNATQRIQSYNNTQINATDAILYDIHLYQESILSAQNTTIANITLHIVNGTFSLGNRSSTSWPTTIANRTIQLIGQDSTIDTLNVYVQNNSLVFIQNSSMNELQIVSGAENIVVQIENSNISNIYMLDKINFSSIRNTFIANMSIINATNITMNNVSVLSSVIIAEQTRATIVNSTLMFPITIQANATVIFNGSLFYFPNITKDASATLIYDNTTINFTSITNALNYNVSSLSFPFSVSTSYDLLVINATVNNVTTVLTDGINNNIVDTTLLFNTYGLQNMTVEYLDIRGLSYETNILFNTTLVFNGGTANDTDGDLLNDSEDNVIGNSSNIATTEQVALYVNNTLEPAGNFTGNLLVQLFRNNVNAIYFYHNFSASKLNMSRVRLATANTTNSSKLLIGGLEGKNKSIFLNLTGDVDVHRALCIYDESIISLSEFSDDCSGSNEVFINDVPSSENGFTVNFTNSANTTMLISGLTNTAVAQTCNEYWSCSSWSTCSSSAQSRTCTDNHGCGTTYEKPSTSQSCTSSSTSTSSSSSSSSASFTSTTARPYIDVSLSNNEVTYIRYKTYYNITLEKKTTLFIFYYEQNGTMVRLLDYNDKDILATNNVIDIKELSWRLTIEPLSAAGFNVQMEYYGKTPQENIIIANEIDNQTSESVGVLLEDNDNVTNAEAQLHIATDVTTADEKHTRWGIQVIALVLIVSIVVIVLGLIWYRKKNTYKLWYATK